MSNGALPYDPAYAATIEAVDRNVGRIVDALAKLGLADDTLLAVGRWCWAVGEHTDEHGIKIIYKAA